MSKLVFFDIDGTIWDEHMEIPESTIETIKKLKENGYKTFLCSGRARGNICSKKLIDLGFDGIVAACGNHVEMDGEIIYEKLLPEDMVKRIISLLKECKMPVVLEGPKYHWIDQKGFEADPFVLYLFQDMGEHAKPLKGYEEDIRINKFSGDIIEGTDFARIEKEMATDFDVLRHEGNVVEFVPKNTSKATGIQWLCEYLKVSVEDTYAIGDSINDLDMLNFVGHGIAMGNGTKAAKEAAEFVTKDLHEDGIYHAMKHYGLI